ncbi:MAG: T9SS type A sorting domain-containing protein, partial [Gemmatimonadetes bacterium]|nr:T9SS type A sorting domain-containing protein [Gemmatimonadota bacterium]
EDPFTREQLRPPFIGVTRVPLTDGQMSIWAGADNGLGRSIDGGASWTILSFPVKTPSLDAGEVIGEGGVIDADRVRTYAAPNPFAPDQGRCRIVYSLSQSTQVSIEIFDFASHSVRTLVRGVERDGVQNHGENWDGLDDDGQPVANGVYFYRVRTADGAEAHGKIVVLD